MQEVSVQQGQDDTSLLHNPPYCL